MSRVLYATGLQTTKGVRSDITTRCCYILDIEHCYENNMKRLPKVLATRKLAMATCHASFGVLNQYLNVHTDPDSLSKALAATMNLLERHAGDGQQLVEDKVASGMYNMQVKLLTTIVNLVSLKAYLAQ